MTHTVFGPFTAQNLGARAWRLRSGASGAQEILLRGADPGSVALMTDAAICSLTFDWRGEAVTVTSSGARGARRFFVKSAIIHEPRAGLYAVLPLASFDSDAKRFWRRVFGLLRVPGGRFLLSLLTRRKRGGPGIAKP